MCSALVLGVEIADLLGGGVVPAPLGRYRCLSVGVGGCALFSPLPLPGTTGGVPPGLRHLPVCRRWAVPSDVPLLPILLKEGTVGVPCPPVYPPWCCREFQHVRGHGASARPVPLV